MLLEDTPPNLLIILAKKHLENKLRSYWLPLYYKSEFSAMSKYKARTQMKDVVQEVLHMKNQKTPVNDYMVKGSTLNVKLSH